MGLVLFRTHAQPFPFGYNNYNRFDWSYCLPNQKESSQYTKTTYFNNFPESLKEYPYAEQALTHPFILDTLLEEVRAVFPPSRYRYLVTVKSQGYKEAVIAPRYQLFSPTISMQKIWKAFLLERSWFEVNLGNRGTVQRINNLLISLSETEPSSPLKGLTAEAFFHALKNKSDMEFPLILLDVNGEEGSFEKAFPASVPNVGTVFFSRLPLPYETLDYREVFSFLGVSAKDIQDRLRDVLLKSPEFK